MKKDILTINGGSSSIKFALYSGDGAFVRSFHGKIDRIGVAGSTITYTDISGRELVRELPLMDFVVAVGVLKNFLEESVDIQNIAVVGHRVVHGMNRDKHAVVSREMIDEIKQLSEIDPEHLPLEVAIMEMFMEWQPELKQVACFDTVFHHEMPRVAQVIPLPHRYDERGVRRYGFHGLSLSFVVSELQKKDSERASGRVIVAHLGNGASITAIKNGKSVDTSMGFSPTGGMPMSSRTGDMDPGALLYVIKKDGLSVEAASALVNHESGLLGVSGKSPNMEDLLNNENSDERAREAVDLFCYEAKKRIGSYVAALGGVETIVFTGGMGENSPRIRARICFDLEFLGIVIDESKNNSSEEIISDASSRVLVRVMHTNEELMIARIAHELTVI